MLYGRKKKFSNSSFICMHIARAVKRRRHSPMATGLTSPFALGRAINLEDESNFTATKGKASFAIIPQAENR